MMASYKKEVAKLARTLRKIGWVVELTNGNHLRWASPHGGFVISASSASDQRAILNLKARLRRMGADL